MVRSSGRLQQFSEAKVRPEAFAEIVTRRDADQGDDLAFHKSRHPGLRHLAWLVARSDAARLPA
jgi:hypothetical protein